MFSQLLSISNLRNESSKLTVFTTKSNIHKSCTSALNKKTVCFILSDNMFTTLTSWSFHFISFPSRRPFSFLSGEVRSHLTQIHLWMTTSHPPHLRKLWEVFTELGVHFFRHGVVDFLGCRRSSIGMYACCMRTYWEDSKTTRMKTPKDVT